MFHAIHMESVADPLFRVAIEVLMVFGQLMAVSIALGKGLVEAITVFDLQIWDLSIFLLALEGECMDHSLEFVRLQSHMVMQVPKPLCEEKDLKVVFQGVQMVQTMAFMVFQCQ